jgi:dGTPase
MDPFLLEREHPEPPQSPRDHRPATERDRDRILHSSAFRRLQGKTQVFGIGQADFYRTRLTHSIETAQLARAIACNLLEEEPRIAICLTPELAEAAALAHDLGHPPFGHAGEQTLDACLCEVSRRTGLDGKRALRFEANAQTFHILVAVEPKSPAYPGLNLTRGTLAAVVKYPYEQDVGNDKFIFASDAASARWVLRRGTRLLGAAPKPRGARPRLSVTCQLLDWADDCAYSIHDVEDALAAQFLRSSQLGERRFAARVAERYEATCASEAVPALAIEEVRERLAALEARLRPPDSGDERAHRKQVLRDLVDGLVTAVAVEPVSGARRPDYAWRLVVPDEARILSSLCKSIVWEAVITEPRVAAMTTKGKGVLRELFQLLMTELVERRSCAVFPRYYRPTIEPCLGKGESEAAQAVCNFLSLLTDGGALRLHALLRGTQFSSVLDLLG